MALTDLARQYWQKTLEGFSVASPLVIEKGETEKAIGSSRDYESEQLKLTNRQTEEVGAFITRTELSTTVLLHGIWASLFYRYGAGEEIVYGCTDDVMTGTAVPMRVKVVPHVSASRWLNELQSHVETARQFFGTPLDAIHKLSGFSDDMPLFKSALDLSKKAFDDDEFRRIGCPLVFKPDMQAEKSVLTIHFDPSCFDLGTIKRMLGHIDMLWLQSAIRALPILT